MSGMPRPLSNRSKPRPKRDALLAAAVEVVGEHGLAGTTHRSVTEAAGVPLATASYYFSSIGELIAEALEAFVRDTAAQMVVPDLGALAAQITPADIGHWYADRIMELGHIQRLAFYEVLINAARSPELAGPAKHALSTYQEAAASGLRAVGAPAEDRQARAFLALSIGFGLLHVADGQPDDADQLFEAIRDLFLGQERSAAEPEAVSERISRRGAVAPAAAEETRAPADEPV
jgi:TetR/AcrR family transcriptional regulator, regulator of biofilm formation and stress response